MSIIIWAKGETKTMKTMHGGEYTYEEDLGQMAFSSEWSIGRALSAIATEYPDAKRYTIGSDSNSGCLTGWEKDSMPGF